MQRSKKHHFVAQSILKRFKDSGGKLWHYSSQKGRKVEHRNTETIFQIKHDNTLRKGTKANDKLEQHYSALDDDWFRITTEIDNVIRSGRCPTFDGVSRHALSGLLVKQQYRSPDLVHDRDTSNTLEVAKRETEAKLGPIPDELLNDEAEMQQILHNVKVLTRGKEVSPDVLRAYDSLEIVFIKTSKLVEPFVIGSAIKCASHGMQIFPIFPTLALAMRERDSQASKIVRIGPKNKKIVVDANRDMAFHSRWGIAGCSQKQVTRLSRFCPTEPEA